MTATAGTHTVKSPLVRTVRDIGVITRRNVLRNVRLPQLLLFATMLASVIALTATTEARPKLVRPSQPCLNSSPGFPVRSSSVQLE